MSSFDSGSCISRGLKLLDGGENIRGFIADRNFKAGEVITWFGNDTVIGLSQSSFSTNCSNCGGHGDVLKMKFVYCTSCKALIHKSCYVYHNSSAQCKVLSTKYTGIAQNYQVFISVSQMVLRALDDDEYYNKLKFLLSHVDKFRQCCDDGRYDQFEEIARNIIDSYGVADFSIEEVTFITCVFAINSFNILDGYLDSKGMAFDFIVALINHSCIPNSYIMCRGSTGGEISSNFVLVALRDINFEEQITMSYTNILDNLKERADTLKYYFFFSCTCPLCNGNQISLGDAFQCPKCVVLLPGFECIKCGYHVDIGKYTRSTVSIQLFLNDNNVFLFDNSHPNTFDRQLNISKILVCLRLILFCKDVPHTRQPFISLFDLMERYYISTKNNKILCLLYFTLSSQTSLLIDIHMHSGLGLPLFIGRLMNFVQCAGLYLQDKDTNLDNQHTLAIHTASTIIHKYLRTKSQSIRCAKVRQDIDKINIPQIPSTMDELEAFEYISRAFLDLVFGRPSPKEYEGVIENYTIAFYIKLMSGCDKSIDY